MTTRRYLFALFALCFLGALASAPAHSFAQGFMVKPMKMEFTPKPGTIVEMPLSLRNTGVDQSRILDLTLVELTQTSAGSWQIIIPDDKTDTSKLTSCFNWATLSAKSVEIKPTDESKVNLLLKVPPRARGVYTAGIIAQTRTDPNAKGISVVIRFLIPIIVEIQGRPEQQKIELKDLGMTFRPAGEKEASTILTMSVDNDGRTYPRIKGNVKIARQVEGRWRPVSSVDVNEIGVLPGVSLQLPSDMKRRLPSGRYKLFGTLYVDGRRVKPLEKEIDFTGDPTLTKLAVDTALTLDPQQTFISGVPGSLRTAVLKIENSSEDAVDIDAISAIPQTLRGVALGPLKGDDLSCAEWLQISPAKFTLRAGGKQNVRVIVKMPASDQMHANYYGQIVLRATYPDGQSAGETTSLVCVDYKQVQAKPEAQGMRVTLSLDQATRYVVQSRFANIGNVHFTPTVNATVNSARGEPVIRSALAGDEGDMLPLGVRDFSGIIDFANVESGTYMIRVVLDYGNGQAAADAVPIRVSVEEGQKVVTLIEPDASQTQPDTTQPSPTQPSGSK
ncbi:MAG: hypothetical protein WD042_11810 [Phycisphaeraceae bacterium]